MNYLFGFSYWKHSYMEPFLDGNNIFINLLWGDGYLQKALKKGLGQDKNDLILIWGRKSFVDVEEYANHNNLKILRVEDGFIRSVSLGSDLTQPYSLVLDSRGIYFDPTIESDLEYMLNTYDFDSVLLQRARALKDHIVSSKLSKYNIYENKNLDLPKDRNIVLVPGQVEDDASIRYGANGMTNLELLKQVKSNKPDSYIIYKPHPDVLSGNRVGHITENEALKYCDRVVTEVGLDSVLVYANEVHTMTSLVGFEALMRGISVTTYGIPFYSGWGLTFDKRTCTRRTRKLDLDALIASTLILYPVYIHPETRKKCQVEDLIEVLKIQKNRYKNTFFLSFRTWVVRKIQVFLRFIKGIL